MLMTADTFKMGTLIGLIFCILIMNGKMMVVESTIYSSRDTALKFSQCLIEKMRESPFFTLDDQNSMFEVQDVMAQALLKKEYSLSAAKILVTAFVTSLADITILDDNVSKNSFRKGIYSSALEQCGYNEAEFIGEAHRILSFIEANKARKYSETSAFSEVGMPTGGNFGSVGYFQASGGSNPFAVQPSPVQNPLAPQYSHSSDKTIFDQRERPYYPPIVTSAQIAPNPQYPANPSSQVDLASSFGTGFQAQSGSVPQVFDFSSTSQTGSISSSFASGSRYENFPIVSDSGGIPQSVKDFLSPHAEKYPYDYNTGKLSQAGISGIPQSGLDSHSGSVPYVYDTGGITKTGFGSPDVLSYSESPQIVPINEGSIFQTSFGGLSIPQAKESSVVVIPPKINQPFISDEHFPQKLEHGTRKEMHPPSNQESELKSAPSESSISSTADMPQAYKQYPDHTSYAELQSNIMNILSTSPKFRKAFNSEISQDNAINLARALTEQTFSGYNLDLMNDALSVVTEEVIKVRVPFPETFAFALSNALASVLMRHDSTFSTGQSQLANSFLSSLDDSGKFYSHREIVEKKPQEYSTGVTSELSSLDNSQKHYSQQETVENQPQDYNTGVTLEQSGLDNPDEFYSQQEAIENTPQDYNTGVTLTKSSLDNSDQIYSEQETVDKDYGDYNTYVTSGQLYPQEEIVKKEPQDDQAGHEFYSEFSEKQTDIDFQSPPLSPEDRKDEMFSISLSRCLSKSDAIRNFFCDHNEPEDIVQISFSIIKASLIDYGTHVAPLAAGIASGALSELSKEGLCNNYATTISEIVAEILEESGIKDANSESIVRKMEQNLIQRQITPTESQKSPTSLQNFPPRVPETETYPALPNLESSFTPVEEIISHHQAKTEHRDIISPFDYKDVPGYKYTHPMTLLHASTSLSTARPTVHSVDWASDEATDEQSFEDILAGKFHTLESVDSKESEGDYKNAEGTSSTTTIVKNQESAKEFSQESSEEELSQKRHTRRKKKQKIITPKPDAVTTCSDEKYDEYKEDYNPTITEDEDDEGVYNPTITEDEYYERVYKPTITKDEDHEGAYNPTITEGEEDEEVYNPTTAEDDDEILHHQDEGEILQKDIDHTDLTESDVKTTSVELQPSFQDPVLDTYSTATFQSKSGVRRSDSDRTDPSLALARQISEIAEASSAYIRSGNFNLKTLCAKINQLSPLANIPPLDYCRPVAAVDYLLNVLSAAIKILKGV